MRSLPLRRLGLRNRTTAAFTLLALALSLGMSVLTYELARSYFFKQRRTAAVRQALLNGSLVRAAVSTSDPAQILLTLSRAPDTEPLLISNGRVFSRTPGVTANLIPASLLTLVEGGEPGRQAVRGPKGPALVTGIPLRGQASYFEISSLRELDRSLRDLAGALALAATATTVGAALIGSAASRRVLRPLRDVATAATGISGGRLDTRLSQTGDADLDPLRQSFNDMAASLQARIEREARFASDVSHELRTPLTSLSAAAQLLDGRREGLDERSQQAVGVLVTQTEHFRRLVLDLLEISRFDAGAVEMHRESVDVGSLVHQIVAASPTPDVLVDCNELPSRTLIVDKRRVERMLANLLQNASLYAGGATRVELSTHPVPVAEDRPDEPSDWLGRLRLRMAVEDAGPGIPAEERDRIFERFARGSAHVQRVGGPKGTGLGLALVRAHARLHGGDAWVEDGSNGTGSRFVAEVEVERVAALGFEVGSGVEADEANEVVP